MKTAARRIFLSRGLSVLVDHADYDWLARHRWSASLSRSKYYAKTYRGKRPRYMHRMIMGDPDGMVDHANCNSLDNRRCNLRVATRAENAANVERKPGQSGYIGVTLSGPKFRARICVDGELRELGRYETAEEAALAYDDASLAARGVFARVNFPHLVRTEDRP